MIITLSKSGLSEDNVGYQKPKASFSYPQRRFKYNKAKKLDEEK
jgi:hypothetical protein